jgi:hypothetical protein
MGALTLNLLIPTIPRWTYPEGHGVPHRICCDLRTNARKTSSCSSRVILMVGLSCSPTYLRNEAYIRLSHASTDPRCSVRTGLRRERVRIELFAVLTSRIRKLLPLNELSARWGRSVASRELSFLEDEGGRRARLVRPRLPAAQASSKPWMRSALHPVCVVVRPPR